MSFLFSNEKTVKRKSSRLEWEADKKIQKEMEELVDLLQMSHVNPKRVFCYRSKGSKAHAYARIWSFPKIFQKALEIEPAYVMEIISEKFDKLNYENKRKVIIHELLHIPKNFSGSLLPHKYGNKRIDKEVDILLSKYVNNK